MMEIEEYYDKNPQQDGHVDIIFVSRFAREYVHFDELIFYKNRYAKRYGGGSGWGQNKTHSLGRIAAVRYILADDKKVYRKSWHEFNDMRLRREDYHHRHELLPYVNPYKTSLVLFTCNESEIDLSADIPRLYVNRVAVCCPPYLCPKTGIIWDYQDESHRELSFSERFWLFKQLPKTRVTANLEGKLQLKRKVQIKTLQNENAAYDQRLFLSPSKTAFLSGKDSILKRLGRNEWDFFGPQIQDPRNFLLKQPKTRKFAVIKSAARYLRKRLKVSPLRPSEKTFFQMMGAMAHINNETLNRKKAYAA